MCFSATCHRSAWRAESAAPPGPVTRSDPDSPHISLSGGAAVVGGRGCPPLGTTGCPALQMLWTTWGQLLFRPPLRHRLRWEPANRAAAPAGSTRSSLTTVSYTHLRAHETR